MKKFTLVFVLVLTLSVAAIAEPGDLPIGGIAAPSPEPKVSKTVPASTTVELILRTVFGFLKLSS